jgi:hypothetical protein
VSAGLYLVKLAPERRRGCDGDVLSEELPPDPISRVALRNVETRMLCEYTLAGLDLRSKAVLDAAVGGD